MSDGNPAPKAPTSVAPQVPVVSMDELLGAIRTVVQAEMANVMGQVNTQRHPQSDTPEALLTSAGSV